MVSSIIQKSDELTGQPLYRRLQAPQESTTAFLDPGWNDVELALKRNRRDSLSVAHEQARSSPPKSNATQTDFDLNALKLRARTDLLRDAIRYTSNYRDVPARLRSHCEQTPIVMAGHQPTLFHPGVWFKNFALDQIARQSGATAVNLVIDNDAASMRGIRIPVRNALGRMTKQTVAYDSLGQAVPFEQAAIDDVERFDRFDQAVCNEIAPLVDDPLVTMLWKHAKQAVRRCSMAGCALAQARHALEAELGVETLEIPISVAANGYSFARFVVEILRHYEQFAQAYNDSTQHYRHWHGIRSHAHPVPNLGQVRDGGEVWTELPLWVYGHQSPDRRGLWVRRERDRLWLSDRRDECSGGCRITIELGDSEKAAEQLVAATGPELKIRPRALVTTMYARLVLSDLFLHGIGGGKYDQLADRIMARYFKIPPPEFVVCSATIRLPGQEIDEDLEQRLHVVQQRLRATRFHAENWVDREATESCKLVAKKRELLARQPPRGSRKQWHEQISNINAALAALAEPAREQLLTERAELQAKVQDQRILASREHSFCLFPLDYLSDQFKQLGIRS